MTTYEVLEEISRWRLAYDTVSALVERTSSVQRHLLGTAGNDDFSSTGMVSGQIASGHVTSMQPVGRACCSSVGGDVVSGNQRVLDSGRQRAPPAMNQSVLGFLLPDSQRATTSSHHDSHAVSSTMTSSSISLPPSPHGRRHSQPVPAEHTSLTSDVRLPAGIYDSALTTPPEPTDVIDDVIDSRPATDPGVAASTMSHPGVTVTNGLNARGGFPFESSALIELFRHLMDAFYTETFLWMYLNAIGRPSSRRLRHRLQVLSNVTCRSLDQATINVLTGYLAGYRRSRATLSENVEAALLHISNPEQSRESRLRVDADGGQVEQAAWLGRLAVELGVALNPRQMLRSFSAVVRDLLSRTTSMTSPIGVGHSQVHQAAQSTVSHGQPDDWYAGAQTYQHTAVNPRFDQGQPPSQPYFMVTSLSARHLDVSATSISSHHNYHHLDHHHTSGDVTNTVPASRRHPGDHTTAELHGHQSTTFNDGHHVSDETVPPPPPPYPSFLLHFLTMLATPTPQSVHPLRDQENVPMRDYSYEAMLELGDRLGEVKNRGMSAKSIEQLPVYVYEHQTSLMCDSCVICLEGFKTKDRLRVLPCQHEYHVHCVDRWLEINSTCPVCRFEINDL